LIFNPSPTSGIGAPLAPVPFSPLVAKSYYGCVSGERFKVTEKTSAGKLDILQDGLCISNYWRIG
jgi:hypothetical protein